MTRYMIYMPVGTQGRLILCGRDGSLTLGEMETLVDGYIEVLDSSLEPEEIKALEDFKNGKDDRCQTFSPD